MFDIGFSELLVCALVAMMVLGPEKLPKLARMVGRFTGQARAYVRNISAEIERETHASELRKQLEAANRAAQQEIAGLEQKSQQVANQLKDNTPS